MCLWDRFYISVIVEVKAISSMIYGLKWLIRSLTVFFGIFMVVISKDIYRSLNNPSDN